MMALGLLRGSSAKRRPGVRQGKFKYALGVRHGNFKYALGVRQGNFEYALGVRLGHESWERELDKECLIAEQEIENGFKSWRGKGLRPFMMAMGLLGGS